MLVGALSVCTSLTYVALCSPVSPAQRPGDEDFGEGSRELNGATVAAAHQQAGPVAGGSTVVGGKQG